MSVSRSIRIAVLAISVGLLVAASGFAAGPGFSGDRVTFDGGGNAFDLRISLPDGGVVSQHYNAGEVAEFSLFDQNGDVRPDGAYRWELVENPSHRAPNGVSRTLSAVRSVDDSQRGLSADGASRGTTSSGTFTIAGGGYVTPDQKESVPSLVSQTADTVTRTTGAARTAAADIVHADDVIILGSLCVGIDCTNGYNFGADTIVMSENNLRVFFRDTSNSGSFPSNDWRLTANDSANGGANKFSIDDADAGRSPFTIEAGAPSNSLYVEDGGRIGIGTSTPVVELHVKDGDSPTLRLEQDGSSGFTPQTWDIAGNEANFFVRDVTNGSKLSFRIRPGAPESSIDIAASGNVGIGTSSPSNPLHVRRTDANPTFVKIENSNATAQVTGILLDNSNASNWDMRVTGAGQYAVSLNGSGVNEFLIDDDTGNVTIDKDLTVNGTIFGTVSSSRTLKTSIVPIDPESVLEKVAGLPVAMWNYNIGTPADHERHLGPMAEDFYDAFGLGRNNRSISLVDYSGVAIGAIQGLYQEIQERDVKIQSLEERLAAMEKLVAGLFGN